MPKVSVIVPIYNVEKYIERCAVSLFEQTLDDIEYIFVDDASPDGSVEVLKRVLDGYPNRQGQVKLLVNEKNLGQHGSRQRGIDAASGEYITHCDPDDWVDTRMYKMLLDKAIEDGSDMVWCDYTQYIDDEDRYRSMGQDNSTSKMDVLRRLLVDNSFMGTLWNRLVKREVVVDNKIIKPNSPYGEDYCLVFQYTILSGRNSYVNSPLYYYRKRSGGMTDESSADDELRKFEYRKSNFELVLQAIERHGLERQLRHEVVYKKFLHKQRMVGRMLRERECKVWKEIFPEINNSIYGCKYIGFRDKAVSALINMNLYFYVKR